EGWRTMPVGDVAIFNSNNSYRSTPYVVSQNTGAYVELSDTLENHHDIATTADAEAYLARVESYARAIEGETARLASDQAQGAVLPGFLNDIAVRQLRGMRDQPAAQWSLVESLRTKSAAAGLPSTYADKAALLCERLVAPALGRQADTLAAARPKASDVP